MAGRTIEDSNWVQLMYNGLSMDDSWYKERGASYVCSHI